MSSIGLDSLVNRMRAECETFDYQNNFSGANIAEEAFSTAGTQKAFVVFQVFEK